MDGNSQILTQTVSFKGKRIHVSFSGRVINLFGLLADSIKLLYIKRLADYSDWGTIKKEMESVIMRKTDYSELKSLFLRGFIGFLALTAVVAIISVFNRDFGTVQTRILATTFTISVASICGMACAAFIERRRWKFLGLTGIFTSLVAAFLLLQGIWGVVDSMFHFKLTASTITLAFAFAHAFLLALPQLDKNYRWVQVATAVSISLLAFLIITAVWLEIEGEYYYRILAVIAILVGLETLTIPILLKLGSNETAENRHLELSHIKDNMYRDSTGKTYSVQELDRADKS